MTESRHIPVERSFANPTAEHLRDLEHQTWQGSHYVSQTMGWSDILPRKRTVVLGEAKCGKTHEFRKQVESLRKKDEFAYFLPLEQLHTQKIKDILSSEDESSLTVWLQQTGRKAWFFLDAVDELKLREGHFNVALRKLQRVIGKKAEFAHIFVSCRPVDWNNHLDSTEFERHFPIQLARKEGNSTESAGFVSANSSQREKSFQVSADRENVSTRDKMPNVLVLLPLTPNQAIEFATCYDPERARGLKEEIEKRDVWQLFQTPADIIDGMAQIEAVGELGSLQDQISSGIDRKLRDRPERKGILSLEKAKSGAKRLALALFLMKRQTLAVGNASPLNRQLVVSDILSDWTEAMQQDLLRRGIFNYSGIDTVGFHHRTTQEFLAAKHLKELYLKGLPLKEAMQLLFRETLKERVVIPSMEPVAAWFALWNEEILTEVKKRKPELLFRQGFPASMTSAQRRDILWHFVSSFEGCDWSGVGVSIDDVTRLGYSGLGPVVEELWCTAYKGYDTRELFLKLIWLTPLIACTHLSLDAAQDINLPTRHRVYACRAVLVAGTDKQKRKLGETLLNSQWPEELVYSIISELYPCTLNIDEVVALATRTKEIPNLVGGLGYTLHSLILSEAVGIEQVRQFRAAFSAKIWESRNEDSRVDQCHSAYDHFTDAILAGCARDTKVSSSDEISNWAWSLAIALHFGERKQFIVAREDRELISSRLRDELQLREAYFWKSLYLADKLEPEREPWLRYVQVSRHDSILGQMTEADIPWLFNALEDASHQERRPVAFYVSMKIWTVIGNDNITNGVHSRITDLPNLIKEYEKYLNPPPAKQLDTSVREHEKWEKKQRKKENKRLASWEEWRQEIRSDPSLMLTGDRKANTLLNLHTWLNMDRRERVDGAWCNWDANIVRDNFSEEFLQLVKPALAEFWRQSAPKLWSEREAGNRNSYPRSWLQALMAVTSEAENSDWAHILTEDDAKLAARISMLELNGFAAYLPALENAHPKAVYEVIVEELSSQISQMSENEECPLIHDVKVFGTDKIKREVAKVLGQKLGDWPHEMTPSIRNALSYSTELIIDFGSDDIIEAAASHAKRHLTTTMTGEGAAAWLQVLTFVDPSAGCRRVLETTAAPEDKTQKSNAVLIFGTVFGGRQGATRRPDFSSLPVAERTDLIFQLVRRVYEVAPPSSDKQHKGAYSPGIRDNAEDTRRYLFELLVKSEGAETYNALRQLAELKEFANMKDRLRQMATEIAARLSEPDPMPLNVFRSLVKEKTMVPTDNQSIHNTMICRLEDYFHFVKASAFSNRITLQRIKKESELRVNIAGRLDVCSRGAYKVNQEALKVGGNRADIKLTASSSSVDIETTIELKLDDKRGRWSGSKLEKTLRNQLVQKYLSHERCFSGCLLVCMRESRRWRNPNTRILMNLDETVDWLQEIADEIMQKRPELLIAVKGLDLSI